MGETLKFPDTYVLSKHAEERLLHRFAVPSLRIKEWTSNFLTHCTKCEEDEYPEYTYEQAEGREVYKWYDVIGILDTSNRRVVTLYPVYQPKDAVPMDEETIVDLKRSISNLEHSYNKDWAEETAEYFADMAKKCNSLSKVKRPDYYDDIMHDIKESQAAITKANSRKNERISTLGAISKGLEN